MHNHIYCVKAAFLLVFCVMRCTVCRFMLGLMRSRVIGVVLRFAMVYFIMRSSMVFMRLRIKVMVVVTVLLRIR
jgi:hypothetical protein